MRHNARTGSLRGVPIPPASAGGWGESNAPVGSHRARTEGKAAHR